jgi:hypothetical protein
MESEAAMNLAATILARYNFDHVAARDYAIEQAKERQSDDVAREQYLGAARIMNKFIEPKRPR